MNLARGTGLVTISYAMDHPPGGGESGSRLLPMSAHAPVAGSSWGCASLPGCSRAGGTAPTPIVLPIGGAIALTLSHGNLGFDHMGSGGGVIRRHRGGTELADRQLDEPSRRRGHRSKYAPGAGRRRRRGVRVSTGSYPPITSGGRVLARRCLYGEPDPGWPAPRTSSTAWVAPLIVAPLTQPGRDLRVTFTVRLGPLCGVILMLAC